MKLVIGGAYQGKLKYAQTVYHLQEGWADGRTCRLEELKDCSGIHHFHELVKRLLQDSEAGAADGCDADERKTPGDAQCGAEGSRCRETAAAQTEAAWRPFFSGNLCSLQEQAKQFAARLAACNPKIVIVSNELGYGVVPMEKSDRMWRETVGRICTCLAERSDEVVRVVCGIGVRLK